MRSKERALANGTSQTAKNKQYVIIQMGSGTRFSR